MKLRSTNTFRAFSIFFLLLPSFSSTQLVAAQSTHQASLEIHVRDRATSLPVPASEYEVAELGLRGVVSDMGQVHLSGINLAEASLPVTITIKAAGYGPWVIQNVPLVAQDTLIIRANLSEAPFTNLVAPPHAERAASEADAYDPLAPQAISMHWDSLPLPKLIRVRITTTDPVDYHCKTTNPYRVQVIDFKEYVKHVLPNEWGASWHSESLNAGAMAVKMYGWSRIATGGKWKDADVWDSTCDQVYNPNFEYASTNQAVEDTWNFVLSEYDRLVDTYYRAYHEQCLDAGLDGRCMGQWDSKYMADAGENWQTILLHFYTGTLIKPVQPPAQGGYNLRFNGRSGDDNENRVLISMENPAKSSPQPQADFGAQDFTIDLKVRLNPGENQPTPAACGANASWQNGSILLDKTRLNGLPGLGISIAGGKVVVGARGEAGALLSICSQMRIDDGFWHLISLQRRRVDGYLWLFVDGKLQTTINGPDGDFSYPEGSATVHATDPFLSIGAWKRDDQPSPYPFFNGWIDELRISKVLRYSSNFHPPATAYGNDPHTIALYHFDEGQGNLVADSALPPLEASHGTRKYGGVIDGPEWMTTTPPEILFLPHLAGQGMANP